MGFPKRKKFRRISIRQRDVSDCGPACLASICASYGLYVAVSRIRQMAGTDKQGSSVLGMVEAALQLGFDAKGVRTDYESFTLDIMPAIVHVVINERISHFIVVEKIGKEWVSVMDPAEGRARKISRKEFTAIWTGVVVLLSPNDKFKPNVRESTLRRIIALAQPHSREIGLATVCAVVVSAIGLVHSYYIKEIIDQILPGDDLLLLNILSGMILTTLVIQFITGLLKSRFVLKVSRRINSSLVLNYYSHVMQLPKQFFDSMRTGEIASRISDVVRISAFVNEIVVHLVIDVLIIGFSVTFMLMYNWQIAVLVLALAPIYILMYLLSRKINNKWQRKIMESTADFEAQVVESIAAATTVRYLALDGHFICQAKKRLQKMLNNVYTFSVKQLKIELSADFITKIFTVVLLWTGSYYVMKGKLTTGELISFYSLLTLFTVPVLNLINFTRSYGEAKVAAERVFEILDLKKMEPGSKKIYLLRQRAFTIRFEEVKFRYGNNPPVLQNVNLQIRSGTITGIKGESGSGKSTLAAL
ncbi:MAG: ATP-binding cassette domain-containing protein, partial [Chitinophagaceae bacterium]|nr:ATP-binding cassette domain-containing protein [Chitinophagaceae bacterium]